MRRLFHLLLLVMFVSISATCVNASTDCERWFAAYRAELAHSRNLQRIAAAKRRAKLYAQRKLAPVQPKPKVVLARSPRMTRKQTLHHFNLACGVLPEDEVDEPVIGEETPAPYIAHPLNDDLDVLPSGFGDMIAQDDLPPTPSTDRVSPDNLTPGGPPIYEPPFTSGFGYPGGGSPAVGTTAPPGTPEVPEPASFVLLLTGIAGAAGAFRQRFKA
jgi:hypothetical protein